jgi:hypothetical protein
MTPPIAITPATRVGDLLEADPRFEDALIRISPVFTRLRNPLFRKTLAKIATLEQAARIAGIPVDELVSSLRQAAAEESISGRGGASAGDLKAGSSGDTGKEGTMAAAQNEAGGELGAGDAGAPVTGTVRLRIDADELLASGEHPLGRVLRQASSLAPGEVLELTASFRPEPLLDAVRKAGNPVEIVPGTQGGFVVRIGAKG